MSGRPIARIAGLGVSVPSRVMTNADFEKILDTSNEWIVERTGIRERHISGPQETIAVMGTDACRRALAEAGLEPGDIGAIVLGTATPDRLLPSTACDLQAELGAGNAAAFDVSAACPGWLYALTVSEGLMASGQCDHALVVGAERLSTITDYQDRSTAILFGDGAGAVVLSRVNGESDGSGVLSTYIGSDGTLANLLYRPGGGASEPISQQVVEQRSHFMVMAGREVFKSAVRAMAQACDEAINRAGLQPEDIDLLVPHQANVRIIEATAKHMGTSMDKVMVNIDRYGNTSAASIPLALEQARQEGRLQKGMTVLLVSFGAGFTWASSVVRW